MWKIPLSDIAFDEAEEEAVLGVLRSRWLTMGEVTARFERAFAEFIGVQYAVAVTNCTAALQLAYQAVGLTPGDEILIPSLTFVATANAAVALGGVPVFVDVVGKDDLTASPDDIAAKVTARTRAIVVVHYAGYACDMAPILETARRHKLAVIEDCAHSVGGSWRDCRTGSIGDVGCFSFFSNKNLTTGEGGMITTNRRDLADRVRLLRSHGMTSLTLDRHEGHSFSYDVLDAGYNFRIDEIRSALGLVQLSKLPAANKRRKQVDSWYRTALRTIEWIHIPFGAGSGSAHHIFPIILNRDTDRVLFMTKLREAGIQTSIHYPPLHKFYYYISRSGAAAKTPVLDSLHEQLVTLPLHAGMSLADVQFVVEHVRQASGRHA